MVHMDELRKYQQQRGKGFAQVSRFLSGRRRRQRLREQKKQQRPKVSA